MRMVLIFWWKSENREWTSSASEPCWNMRISIPTRIFLHFFFFQLDSCFIFVPADLPTPSYIYRLFTEIPSGSVDRSSIQVYLYILILKLEHNNYILSAVSLERRRTTQAVVFVDTFKVHNECFDRKFQWSGKRNVGNKLGKVRGFFYFDLEKQSTGELKY